MIEVTAEEVESLRQELPEIDLISSDDIRKRVIALWISFIRESTYGRISDAPAFPGMPKYDLAGHTRQVALTALRLAESMNEFWKIEYDRDALIAAALCHDASKLVERQGPDGTRTVLGKALLHGQMAGVRCLEYGLPPKVAQMVTLHAFTPPHVHVKPQYIEFILLTWADLTAVDTLSFVEGKPTHLEIEKRFFQLE